MGAGGGTSYRGEQWPGHCKHHQVGLWAVPLALEAWQGAQRVARGGIWGAWKRGVSGDESTRAPRLPGHGLFRDGVKTHKVKI